MRKITGIFILTSILFMQLLNGQTENYSVALTPFSSEKYDEFSPVFYKNGIVFCSNRDIHILSKFSDSYSEGFFKIFYVDTASESKMMKATLFSGNLTSVLNDGPVTFNRGGDTIYYSRNIDVNSKTKEMSSPRNKLGIFTAKLSGNEWTKTREFRLNNERHNITTPCLSPDGKRLYFSSDAPGGYGGSDLYYCEWQNGFWADPVNLGKEINSPGNESYPFVNLSGELFFSSDGHPGLGGKDIFFSGFYDTAWLTPVLINAPVNSPFDDFGFISDPQMEKGYFSSNRNNSYDIFSFKTEFPQVFYSIPQKENQYCFLFTDSGQIEVDTNNLQYRWSFGDGKSSVKEAADHCYTGPGNYNVKLELIDRKTGKLFLTKLTYNLEIKDFEQPYISSADIAATGEILRFSRTKSFLPGYEVTGQSWDFGDSKRSSAEIAEHSYDKPGEYSVNLGLTVKSISNNEIHHTGVTKKILILPDINEKTLAIARKASVKKPGPDVKDYENAIITSEYSVEAEIQNDVVFTVEVFASKNKLDLHSLYLNEIPKKYLVKEIKDKYDSLYSYCIDRQMKLMSVYPAYRELLALGFNDLVVRAIVLSEPSEKELFNLIKTNGTSADTYFDNSDKLTSVAYIMLDQIVKLMYKYPTIKLEVCVHSDNTGSAESNLLYTQKRSQLIVNYITDRGIDSRRLVPKGLGESNPVAPNFLNRDRQMNQRVDFIII
jgi:outer membrane protein OmpA-like peptidoglycan-associated protein